MARPLSDEKRLAILSATIDAVSDLGVSASTASIAKAAGISDGALFVYFATKDALLNEAYLEVKRDLGNAILASYPAQGDLRERCQHLWDRYIDWGIKNPRKKSAMRQLAVSAKITEATREIGFEPYREIDAMLEEVVSGGSLRRASARGLAGGLFATVADMTIDFIERDPFLTGELTQAGFAFFWNGATN